MTPDAYHDLVESISRHEGLKLEPYFDTNGVLTIGYGHILSRPISRRAAMLIREDDIESAHVAAQAYAWFADLTPTRQRVIVEMIYNLGAAGFSRFRRMIHALTLKDYVGASREMLDSHWHHQVGTRAETLARLMEEG
jgi:lysozyme